MTIRPSPAKKARQAAPQKGQPGSADCQYDFRFGLAQRVSGRWMSQQPLETTVNRMEGETSGRIKGKEWEGERRKGGNLHPGTSVSSLRGGTVSNVLAYFLAACRWAWRASISFLVLGMRHLKIQHSVITRERRGIKKDEFWGQLSEICFFHRFYDLENNCWKWTGNHTVLKHEVIAFSVQ